MGVVSLVGGVTAFYLLETTADETPVYLGLLTGVMEGYPIYRNVSKVIKQGSISAARRYVKRNMCYHTYWVVKVISKIMLSIMLLVYHFEWKITMFVGCVFVTYTLFNLLLTLCNTKLVVYI